MREWIVCKDVYFVFVELVYVKKIVEFNRKGSVFLWRVMSMFVGVSSDCLGEFGIFLGGYYFFYINYKGV